MSAQIVTIVAIWASIFHFSSNLVQIGAQNVTIVAIWAPIFHYDSRLGRFDLDDFDPIEMRTIKNNLLAKTAQPQKPCVQKFSI